MKQQVKACSIGPKHKWQHVKNYTASTVKINSKGTTARFSLRGLYRCECGERKSGAPSHD